VSERPGFAPPEDALEIADTLENRGFQAWAVGGAIRDELLGHPREDWDLATDARPDEVRRVFPRTVPLGIEHGTVGVLGETGTMFEVTTFRRDIETDGRHAVVEYAASIDEDLARRDFTINAMAWRPANDQFVDPWEGQADLERRVLRAVGDPAQRVAEDYLRVLRGLRFAGRFQLAIDPETLAALEAGVDGTATLSAERVREELEKVIAGERPSASLRLYAQLGVLEIWYPELAEGRDEAPWEQNLDAVDEISAEGADMRLLRLARLLLAPFVAADPLDAGEDAEAAGEVRAGVGHAVLQRLRFSNADQQAVSHLLRHYQPLVSPIDSAARIREWLSVVGADPARQLFELHLAYARAAGDEETTGYLEHTLKRVEDELLAGPPLSVTDLVIGGGDLMALGVRQGPLVGLLLDELHARVLEDPELNDPDVLTEMARELIDAGGLGELRPPEGSPDDGREQAGWEEAE
jgi:tRNA nucleotidyltransferase (CCA-adding enzyme)